MPRLVMTPRVWKLLRISGISILLTLVIFLGFHIPLIELILILLMTLVSGVTN